MMIVRTSDTAMMIGLIGSEDKEDAGEEDLDDDIDCMYDVVDVGDHGQLENADDEHSETGESTDEETNVFQGKDFTGAGHLPTLFELAEREHNSASSLVCG
jgi:hypothetical protein